MPGSVRACSFRIVLATSTIALFLSACAGVRNPAPAPSAAPPSSGKSPAPASAAASPSAPAVQTREAWLRQGDAYAARGQYAEAFDAYANAEDKDALSRLADRLLKAGSYDLFVRSWLEARKTLVFRDEFTDNARAWNIRRDKYSQSTIQNGVLNVQHLTGDNMSLFWTAGGIDASADFGIEIVVTRKSGEHAINFALAWGIADADDNFQFGISGNGSYVYGGYSGGKWKARIDWKKSNAIATGYATNRMRVRRTGSRLDFFINDRFVDTAPYEGLPGARVGICVGSPLEVDVDSCKVELFPSVNEPLNLAGDDALARADIVSAISLYGQAGNTARLDEITAAAVQGGRLDQALSALKAQGRTTAGARVQISSMLAQAGKRAEALQQLAEAGWKLENGFSRSIVREDFVDNARDWATLDNKEAKLQVLKGSYHVESLPGTSGRNTWNAFPMEPGADFKIEARMRKVSGTDKETYSIIWGFTDSNKKQEFGVTGAGGFEYGYRADGKWHAVCGAEKHPAIRTGGAENLVAVVREGDQVGLFVNGRRVGQVPFRQFFGDAIGFSIYDVMAIEVGSLEVTEYPPDFAIDLARTELYASRPDDFSKAATAMYLAKGAYAKALAAFVAARDEAGARECELRLGDETAYAGNAVGAVEHYLKAGATVDVYRGLAAAYDSLGQADNAEGARAKLADLLLADGHSDEAIALYQQLAKPTLQNAAGSRLAAAGKIAEAIALYRKAGSEARAKELEKTLVGLSASPQLGATREGDDVFGLKITDSSGFSVEIGEPSYPEGDFPFLGEGEDLSSLPLDTIARVVFDWNKDKVSVTTRSGEVQSFAVMGGMAAGIQIEGYVYQAGIPCVYKIELADVKSLARVKAAAPAGGGPDVVASGNTAGTVLNAKGARQELSDPRFYYQGTFNSGYSYWGVGAGIRGKSLEDQPSLTLSLGKGSYAVPLSRIASISFKDKSYLSDSGFRCPFVGKLTDLVVVAGRIPNARLALYPSAIAEIDFSRTQKAAGRGSDSAEAASGKWTVSAYNTAGPKPSMSLSNTRCEVYSPVIEWGTTDGVLPFRAALEDYQEYGEPTESRSSMVWDKTYESQSVPIQIGQAYYAVPFSAIKEFGIDAKGVLTISLKDGSVMKGSPYKNWKGLVGDSSRGETRLPRRDFPARMVFLAPGISVAMGLGVSGSMVESLQSPYGQRGYLSWAPDISIENMSDSPVEFGRDLILIDCGRGEMWDGEYVVYPAGAPGKSAPHSDFDAAAQAYSLSNYERVWDDGTLRGFRNGGTYMMGDPPDFTPQPTICKSTLAAGASASLRQEITQGTYVDSHDRILVALPVVSGREGEFRLILTFRKPDPTKPKWILDSSQAVRLTKESLLAVLRSADKDPPLGVLALNWLTEVEPYSAAPFLDKNIRTSKRGMPLVASIQLLARSGLKPTAEALAAIKALAKEGDSWSARAAKRYLAGGGK